MAQHGTGHVEALLGETVHAGVMGVIGVESKARRRKGKRKVFPGFPRRRKREIGRNLNGTGKRSRAGPVARAGYRPDRNRLHAVVTAATCAAMRRGRGWAEGVSSV